MRMGKVEHGQLKLGTLHVFDSQQLEFHFIYWTTCWQVSN